MDWVSEGGRYTNEGNLNTRRAKRDIMTRKKIFEWEKIKRKKYEMRKKSEDEFVAIPLHLSVFFFSALLENAGKLFNQY